MAVRRLAEKQPASFAFSEANRAWAEKEIAKYPPGRQASAVISLLWRAQDQEGWVSEPAIRAVAEMLDMARIRVLEIATFYTMFLLEPVGKIETTIVESGEIELSPPGLTVAVVTLFESIPS